LGVGHVRSAPDRIHPAVETISTAAGGHDPVVPDDIQVIEQTRRVPGRSPPRTTRAGDPGRRRRPAPPPAAPDPSATAQSQPSASAQVAVARPAVFPLFVFAACRDARIPFTAPALASSDVDGVRHLNNTAAVPTQARVSRPRIETLAAGHSVAGFARALGETPTNPRRTCGTPSGRRPDSSVRRGTATGDESRTWSFQRIALNDQIDVSTARLREMECIHRQDLPMSAIRGRRRRSHVGKPEPVIMQARVAPDRREKANRAADAAGITLAEYLELLIDRDQVDIDGCPIWLPPRNNLQEELPLKSA
jgi:hypothetical protein